jgi:hypothetical protein
VGVGYWKSDIPVAGLDVMGAFSVTSDVFSVTGSDNEGSVEGSVDTTGEPPGHIKFLMRG